MQNNALNITLTIVDEDTKQHSFLRHVYTGKIKEIMCTQTGKRFYPDYTILLYSYKRLPIAIGNSIKVFNYSFGKKSANPIDHFLKKEGIIGTIVKKTFDFGVCSYNKYSLENITHIYRKHHLKKLRKKLHTLSYQLYSLMFLGKKPFNTQGLLQVKQYCKTWGILHHLARSGLHLVACIFTWEKMLRYIPVHTFIKHILLLLFSFIYYLLSWPSISFARSMLVFLFYKMAALSNNQVLSIHIMSLITLLVLLHNPHVLSFLDFQLSFGITFLLTWINHVTLLRMRRSIKIIAN